MTNSQRKNALLLAPKFYGYENEIIEEFQRLGYDVSYINTDPSKTQGIINGVVNKIIPDSNIVIKGIQKRISKAIKGKRFDIVLVISSWTVNSFLTRNLRIKNLAPHGRMILYYWDSLKRLKDDRNRWSDFDAVFSFDRHDSLCYSSSIVFLPLFYCDSFWSNSEDSNLNDLQAIGSFRLERLKFIESLKMHNPRLRINAYLFESKPVLLFHKLFRSSYWSVKLSSVKYKKLSFQEVVRLYSKSKAVLDISATGQTGLTMRTIETLAMHKKIVTSNEDITNYDFYNEHDIYIIPKDTYALPEADWFDCPFGIDDSIIEKYSIRSWLLQLLKP